MAAPPKIAGPKLAVTKKSGLRQYLIVGVLFVAGMVLWMSLPLLQRSPADMMVAVPKGSGRATNLNSLGVAPEAGAPGAPLTGELTNNPANSPEDAASSLYSGKREGIYFSEEDLKQKTRDSEIPVTAVRGRPGNPVDHVGVGVPTDRPKLAALPSLSGGSPGGGARAGLGGDTPFFGRPGVDPGLNPKSLFHAPSLGNAVSPADNAATLASLLAANRASRQAAGLGSADAARAGATRGFEATPASAPLLKSADENAKANNGLNFDGTVADLKKSDPSLNKKKIQMPLPPEPKIDPRSESMADKLMMMMMQALMGSIFGGIGAAISGALNLPSTTGGK